MKTTLWYQSHNPHEREIARRILQDIPGTRLVDVSTVAGGRDLPSGPGWPDRPVRAFPCLVFDSADGTVELERLEEVLSPEAVAAVRTQAASHERRLKAALKEAGARRDVPGGARPAELSALCTGADSPHSIGG
ncbi:MAG: hypothetical protein HUU15_19600 [Candidatus Brocadiae bacterium]|nr:hypothetical protein [Candidatus Brocadiia bacterium]